MNKGDRIQVLKFMLMLGSIAIRNFSVDSKKIDEDIRDMMIDTMSRIQINVSKLVGASPDEAMEAMEVLEKEKEEVKHVISNPN